MAATTTTTAPIPPSCADSDLSLTATTDHPTYASTQDVNVTLSIKNIGPLNCSMDRNPGLVILDSAGTIIGRVGTADMFNPIVVGPGQPAGSGFEPGKVLVGDVAWGHKGCNANFPTPCPAGKYTIIANLENPYGNGQAQPPRITTPPVQIVLT